MHQWSRRQYQRQPTTAMLGPMRQADDITVFVTPGDAGEGRGFAVTGRADDYRHLIPIGQHRFDRIDLRLIEPGRGSSDPTQPTRSPSPIAPSLETQRAVTCGWDTSREQSRDRSRDGSRDPPDPEIYGAKPGPARRESVLLPSSTGDSELRARETTSPPSSRSCNFPAGTEASPRSHPDTDAPATPGRTAGRAGASRSTLRCTGV